MTNRMRASDLSVVPSGAACELRVRIQSSFLAEPHQLWYRFPSELQPCLSDESGDCLLPALLVVAMRAGEQLEIPYPISPRLLAACDQIQEVYRTFDPSLSRIEVHAPESRGALCRSVPLASGLFLSLGI